MPDIVPGYVEPIFPETLTPFKMFCQKVLPAVYDDSLSYYELLCIVVEYLNKTMANVNSLNDDVKFISKQLSEIYDLLGKFIESGFDDYYKEQVESWIDSHLTWIFNNVVRQVYFGLNLEGYFVAYIPDGWDDIIFDTGANYELDTYGRLILRWDADSPYTVNQTPEKVR